MCCNKVLLNLNNMLLNLKERCGGKILRYNNLSNKIILSDPCIILLLIIFILLDDDSFGCYCSCTSASYCW